MSDKIMRPFIKVYPSVALAMYIRRSHIQVIKVDYHGKSEKFVVSGYAENDLEYTLIVADTQEQVDKWLWDTFRIGERSKDETN